MWSEPKRELFKILCWLISFKMPQDLWLIIWTFSVKRRGFDRLGVLASSYHNTPAVHGCDCWSFPRSCTCHVLTFLLCGVCEVWHQGQSLPSMGLRLLWGLSFSSHTAFADWMLNTYYWKWPKDEMLTLFFHVESFIVSWNNNFSYALVSFAT